MPPAPRAATISYPPMRVPAVSVTGDDLIPIADHESLLDRHALLQLFAPVEDDVQAAGADVVLHHQELRAVEADVVVRNRRCLERVLTFEEHSRGRERDLVGP